MRKPLKFIQYTPNNAAKDKNDSVMLPTSGTWREPRDSVITIMFNKFGGGPYRRDEDLGSGFDYVEKASLAMAVRKTVETLNFVIEASRCNFINEHYLLEKWFGLTPEDVGFKAGVASVVDGANRMHQVLSDNTKQLRFVDSRNQKEISFEINYRIMHRLNSANQWVPRGEKALVSDERITDIRDETYGSVYRLTGNFRAPGSSPHVGSGYRVYIGPATLVPEITMRDRCHMIYHEMSHKVLDTNDMTSNGLLIYGALDCRWLATKSSDEALKIADCWSCFFMEFYRW